MDGRANGMRSLRLVLAFCAVTVFDGCDVLCVCCVGRLGLTELDANGKSSFAFMPCRMNRHLWSFCWCWGALDRSSRSSSCTADNDHAESRNGLLVHTIYMYFFFFHLCGRQFSSIQQQPVSRRVYRNNISRMVRLSQRQRQPLVNAR